MANIARFVIVVPSCLPCGAGLRKKISFQKIEFLRAKYELFFYFALIDPCLKSKNTAHVPPTNGRGFRDFYHNWTKSILQQLTRKFWKIADALFRISWMTHSFKYHSRWVVLPLQFSTGPSKLLKLLEILKPLPSLGGSMSWTWTNWIWTVDERLMNKFWKRKCSEKREKNC